MALVLPQKGIPREALLAQLDALKKRDVNWRDNRAFGLVYNYSDEHAETVKAAYNAFMSTNGLNPMAFKSLKEMEHEVVRITAGLLHGGNEVVGTMTSGGTESILLPVLAYRQWARKHRPWVRRPEIIVPESAHAAFYKAGDYFDVKVIATPLGKDYRADVAAMARRIGRNTIALVGSAPCYPYGVIDPIEDIVALAKSRSLPVHVDACLGGFMLPFFEKLNPDERPAPIPTFDFRLPGVTSMSADVHKYGYAPKGASVILYSGMQYLRHQFSASTDWCGGVYVSPTFAGTRPGGAIAGAWASLHTLGEEGYVNNARALAGVVRRFCDAIEAIPELTVLGNPAMSVVAFGAKKKGFSVYAVGDALESKGWHVDRLQRPESLHLILNPGHADVAENFFADLRAAVEHVRTHPEAALEGSAPMYGLVAKAPLRGLVKRQVLAMVEKMYSAEGGLPELGASDGADEADGKVAASPVPKAVLAAMRFRTWLTQAFAGRNAAP